MSRSRSSIIPRLAILPKIQSLRTLPFSGLLSGLFLDGALGTPASMACCARLSSDSGLP